MNAASTDLDRFNRYMAARMTVRARIDKSRAELAAILPALLYWCSQRSGPDPVSGQPYFELKVQPDLRDSDLSEVRAVEIKTWNGRELLIGVNEQSGGLVVGAETFDSLAFGDPCEVDGIIFVAPKGGGRRDRELLSLLRQLDEFAFQTS
jgi:hypothetical protein